MVAPVDHKLPDDAEEVKITFPPAQKFSGPLAEIVGVDGIGFTVTAVASDELEAQPNADLTTVKDPLAETVIACVVAPFDQMFPVADEEVNTTLPPAQKLKGPLAEMVGVTGVGLTVI